RAEGGRVQLATVSGIRVAAVTMPERPLTTTVPPPGRAVVAAVSVSVTLPARPIEVVGLKDAVTPAGSWPVLNVGRSVDLGRAVVKMVLVPLEPRSSVRLAGFAKIQKSESWPATVRSISAVCVTPPPVPVTVRVAVEGWCVALDTVNHSTVVPGTAPGASTAA